MLERPRGVLRLLRSADCHLCEEMEEVLRIVLPSFGLDWIEVDVASDEGLLRRYGAAVPVLLLGDRELARHRLSAERLELLLLEAGYPSSVGAS